MDLGTRQYVEKVLKIIEPKKIISGDILEIGSLNVNGEIRQFFPASESYVGVDILPGPGVDLVGHFADVDLRDKKFDFIMSLNCLEHDSRWKETMDRSFSSLKKGGYLCIFVPTQISVSDFWRAPIKKTAAFVDQSGRHLNKFPFSKEKRNFPCAWPDQNPSRRIEKYFSDEKHQPSQLGRTFIPAQILSSAHTAFSSRYIVSHNVHHTKNEEYFSTLSLGKILEWFYFRDDYSKFKILNREISCESGLQLGLLFERTE